MGKDTVRQRQDMDESVCPWKPMGEVQATKDGTFRCPVLCQTGPWQRRGDSMTMALPKAPAGKASPWRWTGLRFLGVFQRVAWTPGLE